jgi:phenylpropionate dioxygenase-like ring-hydroxylating dioxygenase large terminal subunit
MAVTDARSPGITYQELLDTDTHEVNPFFRLESNHDFGSVDVPVERYTTEEFHDVEVEKLWRRVWQFACREEDIPDPGDTWTYDIAGLSIVLVRTRSMEIKAYWNACLHRGRQLREEPGHCGEIIRCPFHGFAWDLDGTLVDIPTEWDFPHVKPDQWHLPELPTGTWAGFVFVNPDPHCEPLADFLGSLPQHFEKWDHGAKYKSAHVAKIIRCNWKVAQEAFMEAMHVVATHPQLLSAIGDANSQYDCWENFSRAITPNATPSPHIKWEPTEQEMFDAIADRRLDEDPLAIVPEGVTAREMSAQIAREQWRPILGDDIDAYCDAEMMDSMYYTLFPNFHPWGAFNRIVYRFRPNGTDHRTSIMECMYLSPCEGDEKPRGVPVHWLGPDDDWRDAPELGNLGRVFNQDIYNLPKVQRGLETLQKPGVTFANYQETKLRHFHATLDKWLTKP